MYGYQILLTKQYLSFRFFGKGTNGIFSYTLFQYMLWYVLIVYIKMGKVHIKLSDGAMNYLCSQMEAFGGIIKHIRCPRFSADYFELR